MHCLTSLLHIQLLDNTINITFLHQEITESELATDFTSPTVCFAMMVQSTPFIVHAAALLLSTLSCCSAENVYCVTPTQPTATSCSPCPHNSKCATLSDYAQQAKSFFTSNTTMVFLPGDHTLDMSITVAKISSLTMHGESSSATVICNGPVGLSFIGIADFKIHSLTFTSCGRSFDKYTKSAVLLESIEYAELVNCSFHDNLGTALLVHHTSY